MLGVLFSVIWFIHLTYYPIKVQKVYDNTHIEEEV